MKINIRIFYCKFVHNAHPYQYFRSETDSFFINADSGPYYITIFDDFYIYTFILQSFIHYVQTHITRFLFVYHGLQTYSSGMKVYRKKMKA